MKKNQKSANEKVLLTGISGFIGLYCAKELLSPDLMFAEL